MLTIRIISVCTLCALIFISPWWLPAILACLCILFIPSFYESVACALIADLFYVTHITFLGGFGSVFFPIGACTTLIIVLIVEKIRALIL